MGPWIHGVPPLSEPDPETANNNCFPAAELQSTTKQNWENMFIRYPSLTETLRTLYEKKSSCSAASTVTLIILATVNTKGCCSS